MFVRMMFFVVATGSTCLGSDPEVHPHTSVEVLRLNSMGLRSFDVTIRVEEFADMGGSRGIDVRESLYRVVLDKNKEIGFQALLATRRRTAGNVDDSDHLHSEVFRAVYISDESSTARSWPGKRVIRSCNSFEEACDVERFITTEFVGILDFPLARVPRFLPASPQHRIENPSSVQDKLWAMAKASRSLIARNEVLEDEIHFLCGPNERPGGKTTGWLDIRCDYETLFPSYRAVKLGKRKPEIHSREEYEWKEIDGVRVPARIYNDKKRFMHISETETIAFERNLVSEFRWHSVNERLDVASYYDMLEDPQALRELVNFKKEQ